MIKSGELGEGINLRPSDLMKDSFTDGAAQVSEGAMLGPVNVCVTVGGAGNRGGIAGNAVVGSEEREDEDGEGCHSCFTAAVAMVEVISDGRGRLPEY